MQGRLMSVREYFQLCPKRMIISESVLGHTSNLLSTFRKRKHSHEGIVYWVGYECGDAKIVTTCIAPKAKTTPGSFETSELDNANVIKTISQWKSVIIAQVHSHPGKWVDHSNGDDVMAFMPFEGYFSVVVPLYSKNGLLPLEENGFHVYANGRFLRLDDTIVSEVVRVVPNKINLHDKHVKDDWIAVARRILRPKR